MGCEHRRRRVTERTQLKAPDVIVQKGFCKALGMQVV